jgi:hypothetical protein
MATHITSQDDNRSPSGIRYDIIISEGWITLRWPDPTGGVECFTSPSRRGDLPEQIGEGDPDREWLLREVDAYLADAENAIAEAEARTEHVVYICVRDAKVRACEVWARCDSAAEARASCRLAERLGHTVDRVEIVTR